MARRGTTAKGIALHALLVAGAAVFMVPLVWMLGTSVKVPREMGIDRLQFFPRAPHPVRESPYIDLAQFGEPETPDLVEEEVWNEARRELEARLRDVLAVWEPQTPGSEGNAPPAPLNRETLTQEMIAGVLHTVRRRLSDEARRADAAAIVSEARLMVNEDLLQRIFDDIYRRFCIGDVNVRTRDFLTFSLYGGEEWRVADGDAELAVREDAAPKSQEVRYRFAPDAERLTLEFTPRDLPVDPMEIDRVHVSYRGDESWAFMQFEVARAGQLYRTDAWMNLYERDWFARELRWPEDARNIYERRMYRTLHPAGAAPAGSPPFAVRLHVTRATPLKAWLAKLTRSYREAFREVPFARYMMTSFSLAILNILLAIFSCTLVGYAFARLEWPGRDLCFGILLATMMIPPQVTMIPQFLILKTLGWYNTLVPLWIFSAFGIPFFVFLVRQFLKNVPGDLEDAARIDGCGALRIYWHVMLPLIKPVVATIAIFTFMGTWNNFLQPLIYVNDERLFPLALGLFKLSLAAGQDVSLMMAGSFVMTLPVLVLFVILQRYFIQGITLTGTKG